ncbi:hypothetical protein [Marinobacterium sp. BA1]|uniref:hypothetical protein n=1 Tax=Marinobacterium sp. BA1 TaxID=3138931 RepID=UPI0032E59785
MGIGAWRPDDGHEGFTIKTTDFDEDQHDELRWELIHVLTSAGFNKPDPDRPEMSMWRGDAEHIAYHDLVNVFLGGWETDVFVDIAPVEGFDPKSLALGDYDFYDQYQDAIMPVMAERIARAQEAAKDLMINHLIDAGYTPRYATSGYTSEAFRKDTDFDKEDVVKTSHALAEKPSLAKQMQQFIDEGVGRNALIETLATQPHYAAYFGGLVVYLYGDELMGLPLGLGTSGPKEDEFVHMISLQHVADEIPEVIVAIKADATPEQDSGGCPLPIRVKDEFLPAIESELAREQVVAERECSRDIPLFIALHEREAAEVHDECLYATGWEQATDIRNIDHLTFDDYSQLIEGNIVDESVEGGLEEMEVDLSCDPDPFAESVRTPSPSP